MKTRIVLLAAALMFVACGCASMYQQAADPNSTLNTMVDTAEKIIPVVNVAGSVTPWGWITGSVGTALMTAIGIYKNHRKNIIIGKKDVNYNNLQQTAAVLVKTVKVIEDVKINETSGETIGDAFKGRIKQELQDKEIYSIAKAIINGLKAQ